MIILWWYAMVRWHLQCTGTIRLATRFIVGCAQLGIADS
ncbi:hypothetical protein FTV88_2827 [Heliorestis convoluta]|uniref:Uncharacterized protein n=1 Tax=Heliorestis convoluta TaxID=356322 RepID=A0A5Q2N5L0_9FIRM|nr:hypothetical protein FTV88_2827 [Heliorestis convoluta]